MRNFEIIITRTAEVEETLKIVCNAEDDEEALDFAYEIASEFPEKTFACEKVIITQRNYDNVKITNSSFKTKVVEGPRSA